MALAVGAGAVLAQPGYAEEPRAVAAKERELIERTSVFAAGKAAPLATPVGITLKQVRLGPINVSVGMTPALPTLRLVFADSENRTTYVSDKDEPGKSNCTGECEALWPPVIAQEGAKPVGDWSLVKRPDGRNQWAFRGKPFYTFAKEGPPSSFALANGHGVGGTWHILEIRPDQWLALIDGLTITEVPTARGLALTTAASKPLYMFNGKANPKNKEVDREWTPLVAPQLAIPMGGFTVVERKDGVYQWALGGKPLYTYAGDLEMGDSNGRDIDPRFEIAMVLNYFTPKEVSVMPHQRLGGLWVTSSGGQVLYARDRAYANFEGGHNARGGNKGNPVTGQSVGLSGCDTECEKIWHPLHAPADAQTQGYWSVVARPDGTKQWAYQGYPLYSFSREKPGEITGNDIFNLAVNDSTTKIVTKDLGLYWRTTSP